MQTTNTVYETDIQERERSTSVKRHSISEKKQMASKENGEGTPVLQVHVLKRQSNGADVAESSQHLSLQCR